jgi:hypothetical protein
MSSRISISSARCVRPIASSLTAAPSGGAIASRVGARLVTTPQTVHSFTRESSAGWLAPVYSLGVLRLRRHCSGDGR